VKLKIESAEVEAQFKDGKGEKKVLRTRCVRGLGA
jgi:hypothetical protein